MTEEIVKEEAPQEMETGPIEPVDTEEITDGNSEAAVDYAEVIREDLRLLSENFSELKEIKDITDLDNPLRYAQLRDLGLSPAEAYLATAQRRKGTDNRSHLRSSIPARRSASGLSMTRGELEEARELFPSLSDTEIQKLYKTVTK